MKFNCPSMFKVNKHRFNTYIFSIILSNLDKKFCFFYNNNNPYLHKTLSRPYLKTPRPWFGSRPDVGNHWLIVSPFFRILT